MKKVLVTVAALGLVAGVATTASAVEWKMSGDYTVEGVYLSQGDGAGFDVTTSAGQDDAGADAWWMHTFRVLPTMKVNDKITMKAEIRLADNTVWGSQAAGDIAGGNTQATATTSDVYVHRLYMEYASPIGNLTIGRTPQGSYGTSFLDTDVRANKILWAPSFLASGPWSTQFHYVKNSDNDYNNANTSNEDSTAYDFRVFYKTDSLDSGIRYIFTNDQSGRATGAAFTDAERQAAHLYGKYKMDNYFVNGEIVHNFGDAENTATNVTTDDDSTAFMLQVGGKFNNLTASAMYFYGEGNDPNSADNEAALGTTGTGTEFEPLYILTGSKGTGMLNPDINGTYNNAMSQSGVQAFVLAADYKVSDALALHGAIAYAEADEVQTAGQDDEYGWEYNIGAAYKLLDNLTYEAHFGYLDTGDYFRTTATTDDTENVFLLSHSLTMTF